MQWLKIADHFFLILLVFYQLFSLTFQLLFLTDSGKFQLKANLFKILLHVFSLWIDFAGELGNSLVLLSLTVVVIKKIRKLSRTGIRLIELEIIV